MRPAMNMRNFAKDIAERKDEPMGTVSKIIRAVLIELAMLPSDDLEKLLKRYKSKVS